MHIWSSALGGGGGSGGGLNDSTCMHVWPCSFFFACVFVLLHKAGMQIIDSFING